MKRFSGPRSFSASLPASLVRQLNSYALAASAAGVSLLAFSWPCEAEIVYTPANTPIGPNQTLQLDLNHDGIVDFNITNHFSTESFSSLDRLSVAPAQPGNNIWGHTATGVAWASALPAGFLVGAGGQFYAAAPRRMVSSWSNNGRPVIGSSFPCVAGAWGSVSNRYLAFKFSIKGKTHYGWARLSVSCSHVVVSATLTGYAYETVPNRPTITGLEHYAENDSQADPRSSKTSLPQPASLGRLAQGASGLPSWRDDAVTGSQVRQAR